MGPYILRRLAIGLATVLLMSVIFFALTRLTPGDALGNGEPGNEARLAERAHRLGLDQPWYEQYPAYLGNVLRGDLGRSFIYRERVSTLLLERVPNSVLLYGAATLLSLAIGLPLGVVAATRQYSFFDTVTSVVSYVGFSMPGFVVGILLLTVFAVWTKEKYGFGLPLAGMHSTDRTDLTDLLIHMVMPVTSLAILSIAQFSRFTRANMLEVLHQDYVRTAAAKGLSQFAVYYKHALRNALLPVITILALSAPLVVQGAIIVEGIFSWPGIGQLALKASVGRDYPLILGVVMMVAVVTVVFNLIADIAYALADPRIRY